MGGNLHRGFESLPLRSADTFACISGGAVVTGRENGNTPAMVIGALTFVVAIGCELFA
jgi:hypothetical protein